MRSVARFSRKVRDALGLVLNAQCVFVVEVDRRPSILQHLHPSDPVSIYEVLVFPAFGRDLHHSSHVGLPVYRGSLSHG